MFIFVTTLLILGINYRDRDVACHLLILFYNPPKAFKRQQIFPVEGNQAKIWHDLCPSKMGDMRLINAVLSGLLIFAFGPPSSAIDEDALKARFAKNLQEVMREARIQEPSPDTWISLPEEPELYRSLVDAVAFIVAGEGITGSGTVISRSLGLIITNRHVVGSESVVGVVFRPPTLRGKISFKKEDIYLARVLETDPIRNLALLEVISPPTGMISVPLGSTSRLDVGQFIFSVSHPQSLLWDYIGGVIIQIRPKYEWASDEDTSHHATVIQIQSLGVQGSSGDPLFDENGHFIGVFSGTSSEGLNFAITVDEVREFVMNVLRPTRDIQQGSLISSPKFTID